MGEVNVRSQNFVSRGGKTNLPEESYRKQGQLNPLLKWDVSLYQKPPVIPLQIKKNFSVEADEASYVRDTSQYYLQSKSDKRQSYIHEDCGK